PKHAREVAEHLGMILRSTGKVKRGIGTIRQDINVSIEEGARVEIKGVQELRLIEKIVHNEVVRQLNLLKIREELKRRNAYVENRIVDITEVFSNTKSKVLRKVLKNGVVLGVCLRGFSGIVGMEIQPERRLGTEFSDRVKGYGLGGIFHTDELPGYGISEEEVRKLREIFEAREDDCIVFAAGDEERVRKGMEAVIERAREALIRVPEETRRALPNGSTAYMRPLPGAARMYPETDVPPVEISEERIKSIELPELVEDRKKRYMKEYQLNEELSFLIASSPYFDLFERIMKNFDVPATLVVRTLTATKREIEKECDAEISEESLFRLFKLFGENKVTREVIPDILKAIAENPEKEVEDIISELGLEKADVGEVERRIEEIARARVDFILERGMASLGPIMGVVMGELKGKVDGKRASEILKEKIAKIIEEHPSTGKTR
ncbi:MAG: Glu-tRNA(Gln) amidotransferase subunit GatE, partial [Candidatus Syntropharchaeia archaeon]